MDKRNFGEMMASGIKNDPGAFKLAAEVVKLKQGMAELRATIQHLANFIGASSAITGTLETLGMLEALGSLGDGWGHAEDGWPWDINATDGIAAETRNSEKFTSE